MKKLTGAQAKEIRALRRMKDEEIDRTGVPALDWSKAAVGRFYRPGKKSQTRRVDAGVVQDGVR
jgi:uncharacterized protein (DUF4415 family)